MLIKLILKNTFKHKVIGIISIISITMSFFCIIILNWFFLNIKEYIKTIQIGTGQNKFIIQPDNTKTIFKNTLFKQQNLYQIYKELQTNSNIKKIFGIYSMKIPTSASINFGNINFNTDILVFASDKGDLCLSGNYIVVGLNPTLINLYNSQFTTSSFLPTILLKNLQFIKLKLIFGKNSLIQLKNIKKYPATIKNIDNNLPIFGITIGYKVAKEILGNLGNNFKKNLKLIKIIGYTKSPSYLQILKQKYKNFKVTTEKEIIQQVNQKLILIKNILKLIQLVIGILITSFFVITIINIKEKNQSIYKILVNNGAKKYQAFLVKYGEIIIYVMLSSIISIIIINLFNNYIPKLEKNLKNQGYIIKLQPIKIF